METLEWPKLRVSILIDDVNGDVLSVLDAGKDTGHPDFGVAII